MGHGRHRDVHHRVAHHGFGRRHADDLAIACRRPRANPYGVDRRARRRAGRGVDAAGVAAVGDEDDAGHRAAAVPIPHGLERGAERRASIRRGES
jgi:hypothetical protein